MYNTAKNNMEESDASNQIIYSRTIIECRCKGHQVTGMSMDAPETYCTLVYHDGGFISATFLVLICVAIVFY